MHTRQDTAPVHTVQCIGTDRVKLPDSTFRRRGDGCNICCSPAQHTHFACACGPQPHLITNSSNQFLTASTAGCAGCADLRWQPVGLEADVSSLGRQETVPTKAAADEEWVSHFWNVICTGQEKTGCKLPGASISVQPASNTMQGPRHNLQFRCWYVHDGSLYMYRYQQLVVSNVAHVVMVGLFVYRHADCMYMYVYLFRHI
jgi:hypothetical protein